MQPADLNLEQIKDAFAKLKEAVSDYEQELLTIDTEFEIQRMLLLRSHNS